MTFTEEWFCEASQRAIGELVGLTRDLDGDIVEVGCWEGRSTVALANAAHPAKVHAVDTWEGSPGEISADLAAGRDVFATFTANVDELTAGNVVAHRMGWRTYFGVNKAPVKFLHIDAEHTFREVFDNIDAALPLMVPGAVMCGDDFHHPPIRQAVFRHFRADRVVHLASLWAVQL